jgi:hypothetical protein
MNSQPEITRHQGDEYVPPTIQTFSQEEFLAVIGPAQGYAPPDHPGWPGGNTDRPRRVTVGRR